MTPPLLAFLEVNPDRVAAIVVNLLAVAGGGLAGYILAGIAAVIIDKKILKHPSPGAMHLAFRLTGGVIGAVLVALLVFGDGFGTGPGDGPGETEVAGPGAGEGAGTGTSPLPVTPPTTPKTEPDLPDEMGKPVETIRVTVLSGSDVKESKFYVVEGESTPLTLEAITKHLTDRKAAVMKPVAVEVLLAPRTDPQGSGAQSLINAAQAAGLRVVLPRPR